MKHKAAMMVVPTGTGASIGGYAGDACQTARKISRHIPLIVNPNVVNAAVFSGINENMYYVEGFAMNQFMKGNIALTPSENNKIGIIFDKAIPENVLNIHLNTMNAVKTVYGTDIAGYEITEENAGVEFFSTPAGISAGALNNPETLTKAGKKLLEKGAQALAVVCLFEEPEDDGYESGNGVDIVGGIEGVISHHLSKELHCPCAHAPAFIDVTISPKLVDSKASAEYITPTFLPCILLGLQNAPMITNEINGNYNIKCSDLHSVVMPYNCLGSSVVFDALQNGINVFAIKENSTVLDITKQKLPISPKAKGQIIELDTYNEYINLLKTEN